MFIWNIIDWEESKAGKKESEKENEIHNCKQ